MPENKAKALFLLKNMLQYLMLHMKFLMRSDRKVHSSCRMKENILIQKGSLMAKTNYTERVEAFIVPFLTKNGYQLIKSEFVNEYGSNFLRLYIDLSDEEFAARSRRLEEMKEEARAEQAEAAMLSENAINEALSNDKEETEDDAQGVSISINDCVKVSRYLNKWLDKEDFINEAYTMEVCSRGFLNEAVTVEE